MASTLLDSLRKNPYNRYRIEYLIEYLINHDIPGKTLFDKIGMGAEDYILLCLQSDRISKRKINRLVKVLGIKYKDFVIF